ncbi:hypothetical protein L7F22_049927 [Adiantum nelumboides]|nr:hypothetical protein [Adiantum nelumboides]
MLLRPPFSSHNSRSLSQALSEPLRSNHNTHCCPSYGSLTHGRNNGGSSFSVCASLSQISTEDRTAGSGSQNGSLLHKILLQEEKSKEGSVALTDPGWHESKCNPLKPLQTCFRGDVVEIETWCQGEGKAGTRRDWLITDVASGILIGRVTSTWVMMNQDTR